ncbi:MAG: DUF2027 domain-containing protein [Bacteroidales bacterium]|nr:DUF2027 domain-containing protein [Lentimicrobiaceae bacterium]MDD5694357.1 DUF2027 domain-containing protein [Bacteroidales bacterium]
MKFNVGDRVRFLNERGGGVVTQILSSSMVNVAIEDGFEIPTRISELIPMDDISEYYSNKKPVEFNAKPAVQPEPEFDHKITPLIRFASKNQYPNGIYLAFVPQDQKWLMTGPMDIQIINFTGYDVLISFFLKGATGYTGIDYDVIPADSQLQLETIEREEIEKWCQGVIQLLFHRDQDSRILMPVSSAFRIKPMKFYKDVQYQSSNLLQEKALIYRIHEMKGSLDIHSPEAQEKYGEPQPEPAQAEPVKPQILIDRHRIGSRVAEVDLHISSLVDDYSDLKNHEILAIQTRYFSSCLDSALENHYYRVFFIHGIGNGTLKNAIQEMLKEFGGLDFHDAPFEHYGAGAIEVTIPDNI